jgi:hypothetical protein
MVPMLDVPQIVDGVPLNEKQKAKLGDVLSVVAEPYEIHHEFINGPCFHIFFSGGTRLTVGPHGGLWWYLNPQQREVQPNSWDNNQPLSIAKLAAYLHQGNRNAGTVQSKPTTRARVDSPANLDPYNFVLQFPESEISGLVARRLTNVAQDKAFQAGRSIASGSYTRENLNAIVEWKMEGVHLTRVMSYLAQNSDVEIEAALRLAVSTDNEQSAIDTLDKLHGIGVPVASAVLTAINPEKYTIIDIYALRSLGVPNGPAEKVDYYLTYLRKCRELAQQFKISLRTLDHALWQWGFEH